MFRPTLHTKFDSTAAKSAASPIVADCFLRSVELQALTVSSNPPHQGTKIPRSPEGAVCINQICNEDRIRATMQDSDKIN